MRRQKSTDGQIIIIIIVVVVMASKTTKPAHRSGPVEPASCSEWRSFMAITDLKGEKQPGYATEDSLEQLVMAFESIMCGIADVGASETSGLALVVGVTRRLWVANESVMFASAVESRSDSNQAVWSVLAGGR